MSHRARPRPNGFTLIELLVAVSITSLIIVVLLSMTGVIADAWRNGNNKVFTNGEARAAFHRLAEDLESAVLRDSIAGAEWFVATTNEGDFGGVAQPASPTWLMFYTTPTDRRLRETNGSARPGNVIAVSYKIVPQDPISGSSSDYTLYGLYRAFPGTDPAKENAARITFDTFLGKPGTGGSGLGLKALWGSRPEIKSPDNFYISNIFEFTMTYWATVTQPNGSRKTIPLPNGSEIVVTSEGLRVGSTDYPGGRLAAVDISMTILTHEGGVRARTNELPAGGLAELASNPDYARTYTHKVYFAPEVSRIF